MKAGAAKLAEIKSGVFIRHISRVRVRVNKVHVPTSHPVTSNKLQSHQSLHFVRN